MLRLGGGLGLNRRLRLDGGLDRGDGGLHGGHSRDRRLGLSGSRLGGGLGADLDLTVGNLRDRGADLGSKGNSGQSGSDGEELHFDGAV